jgi:hypothetical protein
LVEKLIDDLESGVFICELGLVLDFLLHLGEGLED